jgi:phosphoglycolate phosphatase
MGFTVKGVIFDLDGTLVDSKIDFRKMKRGAITVLEAAGVAPGRLTTAMLNYDIEHRAMADLRAKGVSEDEIRRALRDVAAIMNETELEAVEEVTLVEGAIETLEALRRRGVKLGIVTRSCREYTDQLLAKFGLDTLIDIVAARDDVATPKPDPAHPRYVMTQLGVTPSETVLVGDHAMDALCAQNAGMRCFVLVRGNTTFTAVAGCRYELLRDLRDLVPRLFDA